ncbi:MAG: NlpC/P60 family protein [Bacillota bacterium]
MGESYCIECGVAGVEVRPVPSGAFVCLGCLSTYSKQWISRHFPKGSEKAEAAVDIALTKMGMSHNEMPCSTLVVTSFPEAKLPEGVATQWKSKKIDRIDRDKVTKGDLIFFISDDGQGRINHVGIVVGVKEDGTIYFVHASLSKGVIISTTKQIGGYGKSTWGQLIHGFGRVKE